MATFDSLAHHAAKYNEGYLSPDRFRARFREWLILANEDELDYLAGLITAHALDLARESPDGDL
jgi:hypothetical protein